MLKALELYAGMQNRHDIRQQPFDQWLIIHGSDLGKLFAPLLVFATRRDGLGEQQPQIEIENATNILCVSH
jgi:hypothetical protein